MKLHDFMNHTLPMLKKGARFEQELDEPGFSRLAVRIGSRSINGAVRFPILTILDVEVDEDKRGKGMFSILIALVRQHWPHVHICVVQVVNIRFGRFLLRHGFVLSGRYIAAFPGATYFLEASREEQLYRSQKPYRHGQQTDHPRRRDPGS
jgi:hypothetical protein